MSDRKERYFEALHRLESLLSEDLDSEIDGLAREEVVKRLKKSGFDVSAVTKRTQEALAVARDKEIRAKAQKGIARAQEVAQAVKASAASSIEQVRQRLQSALRANPEFELQFRSFKDLKNPAEIERAMAFLDLIESEQEKTDE